MTQSKSQGASQAMLYATGLEENDMAKPQVGIASVLFEKKPCNMYLLLRQRSNIAKLSSESRVFRGWELRLPYRAALDRARARGKGTLDKSIPESIARPTRAGIRRDWRGLQRPARVRTAHRIGPVPHAPQTPSLVQSVFRRASAGPTRSEQYPIRPTMLRDRSKEPYRFDISSTELAQITGCANGDGADMNSLAKG